MHFEVFNKLPLMVALCGLLLALGMPLSMMAQAASVEWPETPAAQRLQEWLSAMVLDDSAALQTYMEQNYSERALAMIPAADRAVIESSLYRDSQGFEIYSVLQSAETSLSVIAQARLTGGWMQIDVQVTPEAPHKIDMLAFRPAQAPADALDSTPLTEAQMLDELADYLDRLLQADVFSGTVAIAKDGEIVFERAYGMADRDAGIPNQVDTLFNLGSMNKMLTAVSIAQLAEQGLLAYDDPISKYLDAFPAEIGDAVTIHHLLTHTSGIGDYFTDPNYQAEAFNNPDTVNSYLALIAKQQLQFEPGSRWAYSNGGFIALGAIVEAVTGQNYYDYVREHILEPAGMERSDSYLRDESVPNLAVGYTMMGADFKPSTVLSANTSHLPAKGSPAGGGYSTVLELLKFADALLNHRLLSAESTDLLLTGKVDTGVMGDRYGYGFIERPNGSVGHGGAFPGVSSQLSMYRDSGYSVAIMSNYDRAAIEVQNHIDSLLARVV